MIQIGENEAGNVRIITVSSEANEYPKNLNFIDYINFTLNTRAGKLCAPFKIVEASVRQFSLNPESEKLK